MLNAVTEYRKSKKKKIQIIWCDSAGNGQCARPFEMLIDCHQNGQIADWLRKLWFLFIFFALLIFHSDGKLHATDLHASLVIANRNSLEIRFVKRTIPISMRLSSVIISTNVGRALWRITRPSHLRLWNVIDIWWRIKYVIFMYPLDANECKQNEWRTMHWRTIH